MELLKFLLLFFVFSSSLIIRSYLIMKYKWVGKDTFYHLIVAQEIRSKKRIPDTINNFIIPEEYDYPPLTHVFLSLFSKKFHQNLQYIGPVSDILTGSAIVIFCTNIFNENIAILACAYYFFTPMTIDASFSLGPRSIGNFFMTSSLLSFGYYYKTGSNIAIYSATIFSLLVLLSHRLTTQSLVISLIALSFVIESVIPIYILIISFIMATVFTKGFYLTVVKGHIRFITIFIRKILHKNGRKEMRSIFPNPSYLLFNIPIFLLFLMSLTMPKYAITKFLLIVGLSIAILSFLWIFGEGIRHMYNAIFAFAILSALYVSKFSNLIIIITFIPLILFSMYKLFRIEKMFELGNITTRDMLEGFEYIKSHKKEGDILLCLPLDFTYNAAYFTDCVMLQSSGGFAKGLNFNLQLVKKVTDGEINELIKKYNVNWIITVRNKYKAKGTEVFSLNDIKILRV